MWNNLFTKTKVGEIELQHLSTASLIEIYVKDKDNPDNLYLTYSQFEDLIKVINELATS